MAIHETLVGGSSRLDIFSVLNGRVKLLFLGACMMLKPKISRNVCTTGPRAAPYCSSCRDNKKVIVISGPTGAGKSRLAIEIAKRLGGEIISADSVQVYRGLDVGSAKPSVAERNEVPHHLVDILHPSEDYSVGRFFEDARKATQDVLERGRVPIVAGGTGLYLRWYIYGKPDVPAASVDITKEVWYELSEFHRLGRWEDAVKLVVDAGDPRARDFPRNNWYRLRRSLEIIRATALPPSAFPIPYDEFQERLDPQLVSLSHEFVEDSVPKELDYDFLCFFLTCPRMQLYRSIDLRCEEMLMDTEGLLAEASWLLDIGLLPNMNSATRAIGYRQAMEFLLTCHENKSTSSPTELLQLLQEFQKVSRNFAKRQIIWFRNEKLYRWIDASQPFEDIAGYICDAYHHDDLKMVPRTLQISRENISREEMKEMKSYCSENKLFRRNVDCYPILDAIKRKRKRELLPFCDA